MFRHLFRLIKWINVSFSHFDLHFHIHLEGEKGKAKQANFSSMIGSHIRQKAWSLIPSLVPQMVKHLPAMWETGVRSLGQEDPFQYSCLENSTD